MLRHDAFNNCFMKRLLFVVSVLVFGSLNSVSQESFFTQSGYTSLTIKFSGDYPNDIDISIPHLWNPLSPETPTQFHKIDNSTYVMSSFTFGPSPIYFIVNGQYLSSVLLPNQQDALHIHYDDSTNFGASYDGCFSEIFDNSHLLPELIKSSFDFGTDSSLLTKVDNANQYRDIRLKHIDRMTTELSKDIESALFKQFYKVGIADNFKFFFLVANYEKAVENYNRNAGLDSLSARRSIPQRDMSYYNHIIDKTYTDTTSLLSSSYYKLLAGIIKDPLLGLPDIDSTTPEALKSALQQHFDHLFSDGGDLFYDMVIAIAYIEQISGGRKLSEKEKYIVRNYFKNSHISNYILYKNDMLNEATKNATLDNYYFPFDKSDDSVLEDILKKYDDRVIVMDFWATWCGPCIDAHNRLKNLKTKYASREDIVFVYVTNETSNYNIWTDYTKALGGEQYYLYDSQFFQIQSKYNFYQIPTYLIFSKEGDLLEMCVGIDGIRETIEAVLNSAIF